MRHLRWPLLIFLISLPLALLAMGYRPPWLVSPRKQAQPRPVAAGDQEMAWIHTTTNGTTWERFVTGLKRVEMCTPGVHVDDADAFLDQTTAVPEVTISKDGHAGKLRIRWYKITGEVTTGHWIRTLATREPPPLAVIGGGSSDRALELAHAMNRQSQWRGERPILLLTTATANEVYSESNDRPANTEPMAAPRLIEIYKGRTFRFCFTNRQMAEAVTDFVFADPTLRPGPIVWPGLRMPSLAAAGPWGAVGGLPEFLVQSPPNVFSTAWQDDQYSIDLSWQFKSCIRERFLPRDEDEDYGLYPHFHQYDVPFSVGGFFAPNRHEAESVDAIVKALPPARERSLIVLPTSPPPGRRFLRTLCEATPLIDRRLVAVTGDGIGMNIIYRDGEFAWPVRALSIPLVLFTHNSPFAWDEPGAKPPAPPGYELRSPNSTEDALHFTEMGRQVIEAAFPPEDARANLSATGGLIDRADHFAQRLRDRRPAFFDADGDRLARTGEHVIVLRPTFGGEAVATGKTLPDATIEVYRRSAGGKAWDQVRTLPIAHTRRAGRRAAE